MATELASGYISLTVKMAKDAMTQINKDITKTAQQSGKDAGTAYSDEFNKKVGDQVGKKLPDTVGKATKSGGGLKKAAQDAAEEFGKGILTGVEQEITRGGVRSGGLGGVLVDSVTKGAKSAAAKSTGKDSIGGVLVGGLIDGITSELKNSNVGATISGAITSVIGDVDISGPINGIIGSLDPLKKAVSDFKAGDALGGLQSTVGVLKELEGVGVPPEIASGLGDILSKAGSAKDSVDNIKGLVDTAKELGLVDFGKGSKFGDSLSNIADSVPYVEALHQALMKLTHDRPQDYIGMGPNSPGNAARQGDWWRVILGDPGEWIKQQLQNLHIDLSGTTVTVTGAPSVNNPLAPPPPSARGGHPPSPGPPPAPTPILGPSGPGSGHGGRAGGGSIHGPGGPKSDIIPIWASSGEHVFSAADVAKMGGQSAVYAFRNALHYGGGGGVTPEIQVVQGIASQFGLQMTSGFRDPGGATVAGVAANASYHGSGQAGDFSNGDKTPAELAFATYMYTNYGRELAELIHDQSAWLHNVKDGKDVGAFGSFYTMGQAGYHGDHVHVAVKSGTAPDLTPGNKSLVPTAAANAGGGVDTVPLSQGPGGTVTSPNAAWAALINRESSGNPNVVQQITDSNIGGNEASGLFQIAKGTWKDNGGTEFAPTAGEATPEQQAIIAARILHKNPSGADWGAGGPGRESAQALLAGLTTTSAGAVPSPADAAAALSGDSSTGGGQNDEVKTVTGQLADIASQGLQETLLPPGFSNPTQWPNVKSLGALLKFIGNVSGNPQAKSILGGIGGAITGSGSELASGIFGAVDAGGSPAGPQAALAPPIDAGSPASGTGSGPAPGPAPGPGGNVVINGDINDNSGNSQWAADAKNTAFTATSAMPRVLVGPG